MNDSFEPVTLDTLSDVSGGIDWNRVDQSAQRGARIAGTAGAAAGGFTGFLVGAGFGGPIGAAIGTGAGAVGGGAIGSMAGLVAGGAASVIRQGFER
jgi:hypothetical protein